MFLYHPSQPPRYLSNRSIFLSVLVIPMRSGPTWAAGNAGSITVPFSPQQCPEKQPITAYKYRELTSKMISLRFRCGGDHWLEPIEATTPVEAVSPWSGVFQCKAQSYIQTLIFKKDNDKLLEIGAKCKNGNSYVLSFTRNKNFSRNDFIKKNY